MRPEEVMETSEAKAVRDDEHEEDAEQAAEAVTVEAVGSGGRCRRGGEKAAAWEGDVRGDGNAKGGKGKSWSRRWWRQWRRRRRWRRRRLRRKEAGGGAR